MVGVLVGRETRCHDPVRHPGDIVRFAWRQQQSRIHSEEAVMK